MTVIDAWTDPSNPPNPQQFPRSYGPNDGIRQLLDKIKAVELQVKESTSNLLRTAGIKLTRAGMIIDSDLTLTGTLTANGVIDNAALASPVVPGVGGNSATGFAVSQTSVAVTFAIIAIPAGFTQALVHVTAAATAYNTSLAGDILYVRAAVALPGGAQTNGPELYAGADINRPGMASASLARVFSGLAPGNIIVKCGVRSGSINWVANGNNLANVDASIVFLR